MNRNNTTGSTASGGGSGLNNLFALAHLATMTEEERCSASTSRTSSPQELAGATASAFKATDAPPSAAATAKALVPVASSRRPAKKRAVPAADFDTSVGLLASTTTSINTAHAAAYNNASSPFPLQGRAVMAPSRPLSYSTINRRSTIETTAPTLGKRLKHPPKTKTNHSSVKPHATKKQQRRASSATSFRMKANQPSFPVILMAIMSASQNKEYITFLSDKQSFIIMNPTSLAKNVLPIHFEDNIPTFDQFLYLLAIW